MRQLPEMESERLSCRLCEETLLCGAVYREAKPVVGMLTEICIGQEGISKPTKRAGRANGYCYKLLWVSGKPFANPNKIVKTMNVNNLLEFESRFL